MPLATTDPRWKNLKGCYGGVGNVLRLLDQANQPAGITNELLDELINEVQHQGDSSSAMYAVAPHLIALAANAEPEMQISLLTSAGMIYAAAGKDGWADCEDFLENDMREMAPKAAAMLASMLPTMKDFTDFQWAVAALAGFLEFESFARLIANIDLHEGEFHYQLLDHTIPVDP